MSNPFAALYPYPSRSAYFSEINHSWCSSSDILANFISSFIWSLNSSSRLIRSHNKCKPNAKGVNKAYTIRVGRWTYFHSITMCWHIVGILVRFGVWESDWSILKDRDEIQFGPRSKRPKISTATSRDVTDAIKSKDFWVISSPTIVNEFVERIYLQRRLPLLPQKNYASICTPLLYHSQRSRPGVPSTQYTRVWLSPSSS